MRKIYLVCNAHIDPVWQWTWEEGVAETLSTFRVAANFCEQYGDFVFNHNEAVLYEWVERYEPVLFARIQRLVKEGKWHIMGGWYLQPDCNMLTGESFVRQIAMGREYFYEKFGVEPTIAANLDPFGHTRGLVQILVKSGYTGYVLCRQGSKKEPGIFMWEGFDGSKIPTYPLYGHYSSPFGKAVDKIREYMEKLPKDEDMLLFWGVGDHGGGASKIDLDNIGLLQKEMEKTDNIVHETPENYFANIDNSKLETYDKDLNPCMIGCYTSAVRIKQKHRKLENELFLTEKIHSHAYSAKLITDDYKSEFDEATKALLFSQFHDILPGSLVENAEEEAIRLMDSGLERLSRIKIHSFLALCTGQEKTKDGEISVFVYNPHPYEVATDIICEYQLADINWDIEKYTSGEVYYNGKRCPTQMLKEEPNIVADWRKKIVFYSKLPPSTISRFNVKLSDDKRHIIENNYLEKDGNIVLQRDFGEIVINKTTGRIDKLFAYGKDYLKNGSFEFKIMQSNEDPWGMLVDNKYSKYVGSMRVATADEYKVITGDAKFSNPVRIIDDGEVCTILEVVYTWNGCYALVDYKFNKIDCRIDMSIKTIWNIPNIVLKLAIYGDFNSKCTGQTAYGREEVSDDFQEQARLQWIAMYNENMSISALSDSGYGFSYGDNSLNISLIHTATFCAHPGSSENLVLKDRITPKIDIGERKINLTFVFSDEKKLDNIDVYAQTINEKPYALAFFPSGDGDLPKPGVKLSNNDVLISAFKRSQAQDGYICRMQEPNGVPKTVTMTVDNLNCECTLNFDKFEVKALKILDNGSIQEVRLDEFAKD